MRLGFSGGRATRPKIQRDNIPADVRNRSQRVRQFARRQNFRQPPAADSLRRGLPMDMWTDDQMRSIHKMLNPRSIAVVGASPKGGYGGRLLNAVLKAKD